MKRVCHERKLNRLPNYDYAQCGWYFVTICTKDMVECFGKIENDKMVLNRCGVIAYKCWLEISRHFCDVSLDEFAIMPNHVHGIIVIEDVNVVVGNKNFCSRRTPYTIPWQTKLSRSLSSIVRGFKIGVTKGCHENNIIGFHWHKSFHDHIIHNENELNNIRSYIQNNPSKWFRDRNNHYDYINLDQGNKKCTDAW
ncbi:MAG: hypothetical protein UT32_C0031G0003 [Parcubacteria group bacterium GW2011_GWC2_39_14]|nr:MAG: hypothetical protein UT32_C0031G0003 [Parcubacteria group bacterium GW2011_GWC2_39_14]KKR53358.1 MAG: hypothetical protein UT91_C0029G0004 [Parcubacteria group bacterium GW2011_GWA2_40_23]